MPRLVVVPTPIGNLEDITLRALRTLREVAVIFAEDTRHTRQLLQHFDIRTRLVSYHQHNKLSRIEKVLETLKIGDVALVSNAGTPGISDPGYELIAATIVAGFEVDVLPGASAVISAVVGAALPAPGFLFLGFLPRQTGERKKKLLSVQNLPYSLVVYEAPHRIVASLTDMLDVWGDRDVVLAREISKVHQEFLRGSLQELIARFEFDGPRGECTLVVAGCALETEPDSDAALAQMARLQESGVSARAAVAEVSAVFDLSRNDAYAMWLSLSRMPAINDNH